MEIMGLHLPGASFVNPNTPLRDALTREATKRALSLTAEGNDYTPIGHVIDEKAIVNGMVGLLRHRRLHQPHHAPRRHRARRPGIAGDLGGHGRLSASVVPLLARVYPNGIADVNHFHAAGGMGFLIRELLDGGLPARGRQDRLGRGPVELRRRGEADRGQADLRALAGRSPAIRRCWRPVKDAFSPNGGLKRAHRAISASR
ncbi:MAG: dihydroxy-acid dehydratase [Candidatus Promineifilaceae bacterium]